jgi:hypothetical protein
VRDWPTVECNENMDLHFAGWGRCEVVVSGLEEGMGLKEECCLEQSREIQTLKQEYSLQDENWWKQAGELDECKAVKEERLVQVEHTRLVQVESMEQLEDLSKKGRRGRKGSGMKRTNRKRGKDSASKLQKLVKGEDGSTAHGQADLISAYSLEEAAALCPADDFTDSMTSTTCALHTASLTDKLASTYI